MSIAVFTMYLGLFAIPWTAAGLIYPASAGMHSSRWKVLGYGALALVVLLSLAKLLSGPPPATLAKTSDLETLLAALWILTTLIWPTTAIVMRVRSTQKPRPAPAPQPAPAPARPAAPAPQPAPAPARPAAPAPQPAPAPARPAAPAPQPAPAPARPAAVQKPKPVPARTTEAKPQSKRNDRSEDLCPEPITPRQVSFLYEKSDGELSDRDVIVDKVGTKHFAGLCTSTQEERTFRFDRILGLALLVDNRKSVMPDELRDILRGYDGNELRRRKRAAAKVCSEILFTGFKKADREHLEQLASEHGMHVVKTATANLDYLCIGYNAGPTKVQAARERGAIILTADQLAHLLETGEIPDQVDQ